MIRRICNLCDHYFTPKHALDITCERCAKEFVDVQNGLAERTLKILHEKFKKENER